MGARGNVRGRSHADEIGIDNQGRSMTTHRTSVLAVALAATVTLAGCGAVAEQVAEKAVEKGIEAEGGGNVDLDLDNGNVSVQSSDGSFSMDMEGDVPEEFPADVPLPDDAEVVMSMDFDDGSEVGFNLTLESSDDVATIADQVESGLTGNGYDLTNTGQMTSGEDQTRSIQFEGPEWSGNIIVSGTPDATVVSYTVAAMNA